MSWERADSLFIVIEILRPTIDYDDDQVSLKNNCVATIFFLLHYNRLSSKCRSKKHILLLFKDMILSKLYSDMVVFRIAKAFFFIRDKSNEKNWFQHPNDDSLPHLSSILSSRAREQIQTICICSRENVQLNNVTLICTLAGKTDTKENQSINYD